MINWFKIENGTKIVSKYSKCKYTFEGIEKEVKGKGIKYYIKIKPIENENIYSVELDDANFVFELESENGK